MRLDADTYEPTKIALQSLYPGLAPGGYLVLDDYGSFPECRRAVDEFREEHGITEPIERIDPPACAGGARAPTPIQIDVEAAHAAARQHPRAQHLRADRTRGRAGA